MNAHDGGPAVQTRRGAVRDGEEALVERLAELGTALDGEPDARFRTATRVRLVAMAAVRTAAEPAPSTRRRRLPPTPESALARWRGRLTAGLAGAAVAVTALAVLVGVSTSAQPGDPLYGLKRGTEQTQLALASDSSRGQTLLDFATTRLDELTDVLAPGVDPQLVVDTLRTMDRQTADGAAWLTARAVSTRTDAPLQDLAGWTADQSAGLSALTPDVPAGALDEMNSSLTLLTQVGDRGAALRAALDCPGGPATAGTDVLGPLPAPCTEQPAPGTAPDSGILSGSGVAPSSGGAAPTTSAAPGAPAADQGGGAVPTAGPTGSGGSAPGAGSSGSAGRAAPPSVAVPTVPGLPTTLPVPSLPVPLPLPGAGSGGGSAGATSSSPPLIDTNLPICIKPLIC